METIGQLHFPFSPSMFDSLVRDLRGPAPFLRIRAEYRDIFGEPDVKRATEEFGNEGK